MTDSTAGDTQKRIAINTALINLGVETLILLYCVYYLVSKIIKLKYKGFHLMMFGLLMLTMLTNVTV